MRALLGVVAVVGGCDRPAPTCEATVRHAATLEPEGRIDDALLAELIDICTREKWPASQRRCIVASNTRSLAAACPSDGREDPRISEPRLNLEAIEKAAGAYFREHGRFPEGKAPLAPPTPCCESGRGDKQCEPNATLWRSGDPARPSPWEQLNFAIEEPHRFQYGYTGTSNKFTALALGDLDCDGESMAYTLSGNADGGDAEFDLVAPPAVVE